MIEKNEITRDICLRGAFDAISLSIILLRFIGDSIKSCRVDNRDEDDVNVVLIEASFKRLIIGGGEDEIGDGDRARLRY